MANQPRFTHYVSLQNGGIYAAMTYPPGYEDDHPNDYRPATKAELELYNNGITQIPNATDELAVQPLDSEPPQIAAPSVIRLQPEDPVPPAPTDAIPPAPASDALFDGVVAIPLE